MDLKEYLTNVVTYIQLQREELKKAKQQNITYDPRKLEEAHQKAYKKKFEKIIMYEDEEEYVKAKVTDEEGTKEVYLEVEEESLQDYVNRIDDDEEKINILAGDSVLCIDFTYNVKKQISLLVTNDITVVPVKEFSEGILTFIKQLAEEKQLRFTLTADVFYQIKRDHLTSYNYILDWVSDLNLDSVLVNLMFGISQIDCECLVEVIDHLNHPNTTKLHLIPNVDNKIPDIIKEALKRYILRSKIEFVENRLRNKTHKDAASTAWEKELFLAVQTPLDNRSLPLESATKNAFKR